MNNERIPIVFSTDHNYVLQTGVAIASLLRWSDVAKYDVYVIVNDDVTDEDRDKLKKQTAEFEGHRIQFICQPKDFDSSYEVRGISTACYYRLLIPWLLPELDKVMYSDGDVVFRTSLKEVYEKELGNNLVGACPAVGLRTSKRGINHCKHNGLKLEKYHNSGFLIINSKLMRGESLRSKIIELAGKRYTYQDQDILNIIAEDRILSVSARYCVLPSFYELYLDHDPRIYEFYGDKKDIENILRSRDCILHYGGRPKPWKGFNFGFIEWWESYRKSVFFSPDYELKHFNNLLAANLPPKILLKGLWKKIIRH